MKPTASNGGLPRRTRFVPPSVPTGMVLRAAVMERLSAPDTRVAVVTAPGGYGKTSHVAAWVARQVRPAAWVDVEEAHNDPAALLFTLVDALSAVTDFPGAAVPGGGAAPVQFAAEVVTWLGRAVRDCSTPFVLVLDDMHVLSGKSAVDLIGALMAKVPAGSTVVLVGRACPVESLARLRVGSGFAEISSADLALSAPDIAKVVGNMGVELSADDVEKVLVDTEGWPVGVRLAGLAWLVEPEHDTARAPTVTGHDASVFDYIHAEWLWGLGEDDRDFLMRVSGLDWFSAPLCNEVLGRNDSGEVLHRISSDRLLVIPLDRREESYRMHRLLRDALQAEFERRDAAGVELLHRRASRWFEAAGDIDRAVQHAVAAGDLVGAERLVVEHTPSFHTNGRHVTVQRWLDSIPRDHVLRSSSLCLCTALTMFGLGNGAATAAWIRFSEHALASSPHEDPMARLRLLTFRSSMNTGPVTPALDDARRAYQDLPPGTWHAHACLVYGTWSWIRDDDGAAEILAEGAEEAAISGAPELEAGCKAVLSMVAYQSGDLPHAAALADAARRLLVDHGLGRTPALPIVNAVNALASAGLGDPKAAHDDWLLARRQLAYYHDVCGWAKVQTLVALAHTSLLLGDRVGAGTLLNEMRSFLARQPDAARAHRQAAELDGLLHSSRRLAAIGPSALTTAELRVLHYLPTNLSLAEISDRLYISRFTAKTQCASIYRKLGVRSRTEAVELSQSVGLLPPAGRHDAHS